MRSHHLAQHLGAQTLTVVLRGYVEVFDPLLVGLGADRYDARRGARNVNNKGVRRAETGKEALPDAHRVPASEAFEIGPHDQGTELGNP